MGVGQVVPQPRGPVPVLLQGPRGETKPGAPGVGTSEGLCWGPRGVFGGCGSREPTRCVCPGALRTPSRVKGRVCPNPPALVGVVRPCPGPWSQVSSPGAMVAWAFLPWLRVPTPCPRVQGSLGPALR